MKTQLKTIALAVSLLGAAQAHAFDLCGGMCATPIEVAAGSTFTIGSIFTNPVTPSSPISSGVGSITQITGPTGPTYNFAGLGTAQVNFVFSNYVLDASSTATNAFFNMGVINVYVTPTGTFNPFGAGNQATDIAAASSGTLVLTLTGHAFPAGHIPADQVGHTSAATGTNLFGLLGGLSQGTEIGLLDSTGGLFAANFDTNSQEDGADFTFNAGFDNSLSALHGWGLGGAANLQTTAIPEPSTVALLGLGLLGFGVSSIRRRKSAE